jgi:3-oxoacyl-[acyl-carrier protein] reductase
MSEFAGQVVVVTGANRGIGRAVAELFADRGAHVAVTARNLEAAEATAAALGGGARPFRLDVLDGASIEGAVKEILGAWGKVDVWVNNAGVTRDNLALRMKPEEWQSVLDANLTGVFLCIKAVLRPMMKARKGSVVNISSVVGATGNPGQPNYCAAKAGLEGLTRSLALEYAERNVRFNCVAPGFIATDMTEALDEKQRAALMSRIPLNRLGTGRDVAEAVAFLASERSSYMTGQVLHVNGGMYLG